MEKKFNFNRKFTREEYESIPEVERTEYLGDTKEFADWQNEKFDTGNKQLLETRKLWAIALNEFSKKIGREVEEKLKTENLKSTLQANLMDMQENQEKKLRERQAEFETYGKTLDDLISKKMTYLSTSSSSIDYGRGNSENFTFLGNREILTDFFRYYADTRG